MFPVILDLSMLNVAVVGNGAAAARRVHLLDEGGANGIYVFSQHPNEELQIVAGERLKRRWPREAEIRSRHIVFTAELANADARRIAAWARRHGTFINTEDVRPLCDFHVPSMVRRGELLLTVSTGGRSPGLARRLRGELETAFGREWERRLEELSEARDAWRADDMPVSELARRTNALIDTKGWL